MSTRAVIRRERGASLMVALIFIVILAMLGATVAGVSGMEERMASGTRDRNMALQAAEAALRDAEKRLLDATFRAGPFPAWDATRRNDASFWEGCFKTPAAPCLAPHDMSTPVVTSGGGAVTSAQGAVAIAPQYVIETKPDAGTTKVFLVTARAVGGSEDAIVVLQAEFGYTPPP